LADPVGATTQIFTLLTESMKNNRGQVNASESRLEEMTIRAVASVVGQVEAEQLARKVYVRLRHHKFFPTMSNRL